MKRMVDRTMDRKIKLTAVLLAVLAMVWVLPSCSLQDRTSPPSITEGEFPFLDRGRDCRPSRRGLIPLIRRKHPHPGVLFPPLDNSPRLCYNMRNLQEV